MLCCACSVCSGQTEHIQNRCVHFSENNTSSHFNDLYEIVHCTCFFSGLSYLVLVGCRLIKRESGCLDSFRISSSTHHSPSHNQSLWSNQSTKMSRDCSRCSHHNDISHLPIFWQHFRSGLLQPFLPIMISTPRSHSRLHVLPILSHCDAEEGN